jgi:hypothetical protein
MRPTLRQQHRPQAVLKNSLAARFQSRARLKNTRLAAVDLSFGQRE